MIKPKCFRTGKELKEAKIKPCCVLLKHSKPREGSFSRLLGSSVIELVQFTEKKGRKIYEGRYWGDQGFIHFCFDIKDMQGLKKHCAALGHPFTVEKTRF